MRNIVIEHLKKTKIEIVERKGLGHPDNICDAVCEEASKALSQYYLKNFKKVLHHNIDKGLLVAGQSAVDFNGGKILRKIKLFIVGRATTVVGNKKIPVHDIVVKAVRKYLKKNFKNLNTNDVEIITDIAPGATNLKRISDEKEPIANDTSFGVAHYPYTKLEKLVMDVTEYINSADFRKRHPVGEDVKVMGYYDGKIKLILAIAFVSKKIGSINEYFEAKKKVIDDIKKKFKVNDVELNTMDGNDISSIYLTVTGLSAEHGDDGQVGRSNRPSGLITPYQPMSLEATAGKNINHPGKLYQAVAFELAKKISKLGCGYVSVHLLSGIGKSLKNPKLVHVQVEKIKKKQIEKAVNNVFDNLKAIQKGIVEGRYRLF